MREIQIEGRWFTLSGEAGDPYYEEAQVHVDSYADIRRIAGQLRDGAVVFDVGANIGLSTMLLATLNPSLILHAFEPSPRNFAHLARNVEQIGSDRIHIHRQAASDREGVLSFREVTADQGGSGGWSHVVASDADRIQDGTVAVPRIPLDAFLDLAPAFLKIDVEGHEPEALAGAAEILARHGPLIHMEFNPWTLSAYGQHSLSAFADTLFRCFDIEGSMTAGTDLLYATVAKGTLMDLVMRPKTPFARPSLGDLSYPRTAVRRIETLSAAT